MENIMYNISQVLGITLIHSLWQGLLIYFQLKLVLLVTGRLSSSKKYLLSTISLVALTVWFGFTLVSQIQLYTWLAVKPSATASMPLLFNAPAGLSQLNVQTSRYYNQIEVYMPYLSSIYFAGLIFNSVRLALARKKIIRVRKSMSLAVQLHQQVARFEKMMGMQARVRIGFSRLIDVPCMVGYFKPVILLPFTLSTFLNAEEIEAIILHELAHIKRNDYLIHFFQQVTAILLFFNPCVRLINRLIDEERENCCDDLVVNVLANPLTYAKALLKLEQNRANTWQLALAANGNKYHLLNRVQRIMKTKNQTQSVRPVLLAMLLLTIGIGSAALLNPQIAQGKISLSTLPVLHHLLTDTVPSKHKPVAKKYTEKQLTAKKLAKDKFDRSTFAQDNKLQELNAEIQKHSEAVNSFYSSGDFRATQEALQLKAKELEELANNPQLKKLQQDQQLLGNTFSTDWGDNDKLKKLQETMGTTGKNIGEYFNSAEFKQMNEELEKKYHIPHNRRYYNDLDTSDTNYRKYQAELQSRLPAQIKEQTELLKKLGQQMSARFNSPEFREKNEKLKIIADSMQKQFAHIDMKSRQEDMQKLALKMRGYQNNPQLKIELRLLNESVKKMTDYINSPEYRKQLEKLKRQDWDNAEWMEKQDKAATPEKEQKQE
jgi:beta-lactamase regulating signal transducer with metallopeptidase domain